MTNQLLNKRIFISEDNSLNRVIYTVVLKRSRAIVEFDNWGKDTLEHLQKFNPDLIILDLMLPRGNSGFVIFEMIQKIPEYASIPVVAISASEPSFAIPKCKQMGFAGYIAKPIEESLLSDQLVRLIDGEQIWYSGERYGGLT